MLQSATVMLLDTTRHSRCVVINYEGYLPFGVSEAPRIFQVDICLSHFRFIQFSVSAHFFDHRCIPFWGTSFDKWTVGQEGLLQVVGWARGHDSWIPVCKSALRWRMSLKYNILLLCVLIFGIAIVSFVHMNRSQCLRIHVRTVTWRFSALNTTQGVDWQAKDYEVTCI